ncbi:hypothetical protein HKD37_15G043549 [Glycine soja]|nr:hypothetical protein GmHk_15G044583 [Glycine max]
MEDEDGGWGEMFYSLQKWDPQLRPAYRLTWMHCWGIPLIAWDIHHIKQIVSSIGDMMDADEDVEELRKLDMARVLIKTPWKPLIQHTVNVQIQGEVYAVHIVEDSEKSCVNCRRQRWNDYSSLEDICSEESEAEISRGDSLPTWWNCMRPQNRMVASGEPSGGVTVSGEENDGEHPAVAREARTTEVKNKLACGEGMEAQTSLHDAEQPLSERPSEDGVTVNIGAHQQQRETTPAQRSPEKLADSLNLASEEAVSGKRTIGSGDGPELEDMAITRWARTQTDSDQSAEDVAQLYRRDEVVLVQTDLHKKGEKEHNGKGANEDSREKFHGNGKMGADVNVEDIGRFKPVREEPRDGQVERGVEKGNANHTPTKIAYPYKASPNSLISAQFSPCLVYYRKGVGKKKLGHGSDAYGPRSATQKAENRKETQAKDHLNKNQSESQLNNILQHQQVPPKSSPDRETQAEIISQEA